MHTDQKPSTPLVDREPEADPGIAPGSNLEVGGLRREDVLEDPIVVQARHSAELSEVIERTIRSVRENGTLGLLAEFTIRSIPDNLQANEPLNATDPSYFNPSTGQPVRGFEELVAALHRINQERGFEAAPQPEPEKALEAQPEPVQELEPEATSATEPSAAPDREADLDALIASIRERLGGDARLVETSAKEDLQIRAQRDGEAPNYDDRWKNRVDAMLAEFEGGANVIVLRASPGTGKSVLTEQLGMAFEERGGVSMLTHSNVIVNNMQKISESERNGVGYANINDVRRFIDVVKDLREKGEEIPALMIIDETSSRSMSGGQFVMNELKELGVKFVLITHPDQPDQVRRGMGEFQRTDNTSSWVGRVNERDTVQVIDLAKRQDGGKFQDASTTAVLDNSLRPA